MANITAKDVSELRAKTGLGMMDCKKALVEADGDVDKALKILREKGLATAAKKESRIAAEGIVDCMTEGDVTAMIEVNTETDFVAKNASFKEFVRGLLATLVAGKPADMDAFMKMNFAGSDVSVEAALIEKIAIIGEKISIRRFVIVEGTVATYIHGMGTTGVIVKFEADAAAKENADFAAVTKNIALQIAAGSPPTYVKKEDVPASVLEEEKAIIKTQMANDPKMAGKPEKVLEGIVMGKLGNYYKANCLVEQPYVKDDKLTVGQYLKAASKELGGNVDVVDFKIFEKGEGLQKREDNFAEEIAKLTGKQ